MELSKVKSKAIALAKEGKDKEEITKEIKELIGDEDVTVDDVVVSFDPDKDVNFKNAKEAVKLDIEIAVKKVIEEIKEKEVKTKKVEKALIVPDNSTIKSLDLRHKRLTVFEEKDVEDMYGIGQWFLALRAKSRNHQNIDAENYCRNKNISIDYIEKDLSSDTNETGGYLVPQQLLAVILKYLNSFGTGRKLFNFRTATTSPMLIPKLGSTSTAYYETSQNETKDDSDPTYDRIRVNLETIYVLTHLSDTLIADSAVDIAEEIAMDQAYATLVREDTSWFWGTGVADRLNGGILGLVPSIVATNGPGVITPAASDGVWANITRRDFMNMVGVIQPYTNSMPGPRSSFLCNWAFYQNVMNNLKLANEVSIVAIEEGFHPGKFLGYDVNFSTTFPAAEDVDPSYKDEWCLFGRYDLAVAAASRQGSTVGIDRGGDHFDKNQTAIKTVERVGITVHDVGDDTKTGSVVVLSG